MTVNPPPGEQPPQPPYNPPPQPPAPPPAAPQPPYTPPPVSQPPAAPYVPPAAPPPPGYPPPGSQGQWPAQPPAAPPGYGQQPYGAPGAPPSGPARSGFDPKAVNPLDWAILGCGFLALIFSFFSYYTASVHGFASVSGSAGAWHGFFGWFAALLALVSASVLAVALFVPDVRIPYSVRLLCLAGFALATVCVLLAWIVTPSSVGGGVRGIDTGRGVGFYLSLIVIVAGFVLSFLRLRATGGKLPWEAKK